MGQVIRGGEQSETHIEADHRGQIIRQGHDSGAIDAFGRQRVSGACAAYCASNNRAVAISVL